MVMIRDLDKLKSDSAEFKRWIEQLQQLNEKLEEFLSEKRNEWNNTLRPLVDRLRSKSPDDIIDMQALALSYRQMVSDQISTFMNKLSKEMVMMKKAEADRFMFYMTGFGLKTNTGEKKIMFDAELSELERNKELLQTHIEFLRDCKQQCDNVGWALKNRIALMGILDT